MAQNVRGGSSLPSDSLRGSLWEIERTPHGRTVTCEARSGGFAFGRGSRMLVTDDAERDRTFERSCKKNSGSSIRFSYVTPFDETMHIIPEMNLCRLP